MHEQPKGNKETKRTVKSLKYVQVSMFVDKQIFVNLWGCYFVSNSYVQCTEVSMNKYVDKKVVHQICKFEDNLKDPQNP